MPAERILSYTPREFMIMMQANVERHYDEYERMAIEAIMREGAHRAKKPKATDLFKRPKEGISNRNNLAEMKEETERLNDWLARITPARKEDANG
ncbi:hypothetical protein [Lederbergia citri]|uniref:Uncharacterized protein n=1 Tax=Lederbergia citri TaxID=2833580 RepID=A0A942TF18_9BACI|nr:hypothetical protein [Lederbergia citri]MBS4195327.1 hypothetical protein [Lederbergia citri]